MTVSPPGASRVIAYKSSVTTNIRTAKSRYTVEAVEAPFAGPTVIVARGTNGRLRRIARKDVGRPRFDAAVARFFAVQKAARAVA